MKSKTKEYLIERVIKYYSPNIKKIYVVKVRRLGFTNIMLAQRKMYLKQQARIRNKLKQLKLVK
jgi:ribosomal protein L19